MITVHRSYTLIIISRFYEIEKRLCVNQIDILNGLEMHISSVTTKDDLCLLVSNSQKLILNDEEIGNRSHTHTHTHKHTHTHTHTL